MARGDAFVAEVAVEFVDALEAADEEALEVEFGRDAQIQINVERVHNSSLDCVNRKILPRIEILVLLN